MAVLTHSATSGETAAAIETLDTISRLGAPLPAERRTALTAALERGSPSGMAPGSWAHLFNCGCNALSAGQPDPDPQLIGLLEGLAVGDSRQVIRLYALQHLGMLYAACDADTQERIRTLVSGILEERPVSPVAGTALVLARLWEKADNPAAGASALSSALLISVDAALPVDVRVSALHTAGENAAVLETSRSIAADPIQPAILRKSALHLIGRYGSAADLPLLHRCSRESPRMAQAGSPAADAIQARLEGNSQPILRPY